MHTTALINVLSGTQENAFLIFFGKECLQKQKKILLMIYYQGSSTRCIYVFMNYILQSHCVQQSICTYVCVEGNKIEIEGGQDIKSEKYVVFDLLKTFFFILYILLMSCFFQKYLHLDSFLKMSDSAGLKIPTILHLLTTFVPPTQFLEQVSMSKLKYLSYQLWNSHKF